LTGLIGGCKLKQRCCPRKQRGGNAMKRNSILSYMELAELKGKIRGSRYKTLETFSSEIPMTTATLSLKLNGKSSFTTPEICKMSKLLDIKEEEMLRYFFPSMFPKETIPA
jgi:hypothetical protein